MRSSKGWPTRTPRMKPSRYRAEMRCSMSCPEAAWYQQKVQPTLFSEGILGQTPSIKEAWITCLWRCLQLGRFQKFCLEYPVLDRAPGLWAFETCFFGIPRTERVAIAAFFLQIIDVELVGQHFESQARRLLLLQPIWKSILHEVDHPMPSHKCFFHREANQVGLDTGLPWRAAQDAGPII